MNGGDIETADDVGARTRASIEALADTDNSRESDRTDHTHSGARTDSSG